MTAPHPATLKVRNSTRPTPPLNFLRFRPTPQPETTLALAEFWHLFSEQRAMDAVHASRAERRPPVAEGDHQ